MRNRRPRLVVVSEVAGTIGTSERDRALAASGGLTGTPTVEATPLGVGVAREDTRTRSRIDLRLVVAIAAVWLLWGSTFAGMRVTVATIPPFVMAALRFLIAGGLLYGVSIARGAARPTRADLVRGAVSGAALLLFGNGATAWTVQFLPTGMNSLLLSLSPVWMALIAFFWGGERPTRAAVVGMVLGFLGLGLLLQPHGTSALPIVPVVVTLLSSVSWAFGSIYQRRAGTATDVVTATALQMLFGGGYLVIAATAFGEWPAFDVHRVTAGSFAGLLYLALFGGVLAYSAYVYTMQYASAALASTYAYVNPLVAVIIGILLFHERFTAVEGVAGAVIVAGVALMMLPRRTASARPSRTVDAAPAAAVTREAV